MLPEHMPKYKRKLLEQIEELVKGFSDTPAQDMIEYHARLGKLSGFRESLELFNKYINRDDD